MGKKISAQYSNSNPIFIGVLNGSFIFMADLLRSVTIDCEVDFIKIRSYSGQKSSGTIKLLKDISSDIKGRDVIIVEDIIDTNILILENEIIEGRKMIDENCTYLKKTCNNFYS